MIVTTTPSVEGKRITRYCGIVTGEAILGANLFRDFFANIRDLVGGRSAAYENVLRSGRETALAEVEENARELGANAPTDLFERARAAVADAFCARWCEP